MMTAARPTCWRAWPWPRGRVGAREAIVYLKGSFAAAGGRARGARGARALAGAATSRIRRGDDTLHRRRGDRASWRRSRGGAPGRGPSRRCRRRSGFAGRPTLVQNVETLARVPAARRAIPRRSGATETTLVSLWGHVRAAGRVRGARWARRSRASIDEHGGGRHDGLGLVFPAGPSARAARAPTRLDTPLDPDALRARGLRARHRRRPRGRTVRPVRSRSRRRWPRFFERESCGQCPPCTVGHRAAWRASLRALEAGEARAKRPAATCARSAGFMAGHGYCAHCRTAAACVPGSWRGSARSCEAHLDARGVARAGPRPPTRSRPARPSGHAIEAVLAEAA